MPSEQKFLCLLLFAAFLNDILWMLTIPYNRAPDEYLHLQMVSFIFNHLRLPVYGVDLKPIFLKSQEVIVSPYASMPGLNYILAAVGGVILSFFFKNINILYVARFFSVIFHLLTIFIVFKISEIVFPKNKIIKVFMVGLMAFIPQMTFNAAYVNIDAFTMMSSTLLIYSLLLAKKRSFDLKSAMLLGVSVSFVILGKYNGYVVIFLGIIFLLFFLRENKRKVTKFIAVVLIIPLLASGWWFIRNAALNKGDILGLKIQNTEFTKLNQKLKKQNIIIQNKKSLKSSANADYFYILTKTNWLTKTFQSSWGYFDYMKIKMQGSYYYVLMILTLLAMVGTLFSLRKENKLKKQFIIMSIFAIFVAGFASLNLSLYTDFQPQGRYLFPAVSAFLVLFAYGLYNIFSKAIVKKIVLFSVIVFIIFLNISAFLYCIVPAYYINLDLDKKSPLSPQPIISLEKNSELSQSFIPISDSLSSIKIKFSGINTLTTLKISINSSMNGNPIRRHRLVLKSSDQKTVVWNFYPIKDSQNKKLYFTIKPYKVKKINLFLAGQKYHEGKLFINRQPTNKDIFFNLLYSSTEKKSSLKELWKISVEIFMLFTSVFILEIAVIIYGGILIFYSKPTEFQSED